MPALPPGPRRPRAVQTAAWITRPGPFMVRAQARHGDVFTMRIGGEPPWVMLAHPDAVKRGVHRATRRCSTRARPTSILRPLVGHASVLLLDGPQHMSPAQADAAAVPRRRGWPATRSSCARSPTEHVASLAARDDRAARPADAGDHARRRPARDLRRRRGLGAPRAGCARACGRCSDACSAAASMLAMSAIGPRNVERAHLFQRWLRARRRAALRADRRAPPRRPRATTSSRCCSPPATTTASR